MRSTPETPVQLYIEARWYSQSSLAPLPATSFLYLRNPSFLFPPTAYISTIVSNEIDQTSKAHQHVQHHSVGLGRRRQRDRFQAPQAIFTRRCKHHSTSPSKSPSTLTHHLLLHQGPNPWKVAIVLNELNLPYETEVKQFPELKTPAFEELNPNGRVPALEDPNTGFTLWESGAIIEYLLETYDAKNSLSYAGGKEKWQSKCWMHFQMSGQGPYFGQRAWFILVRQNVLVISWRRP